MVAQLGVGDELPGFLPLPGAVDRERRVLSGAAGRADVAHVREGGAQVVDLQHGAVGVD